MCLTWMWDVMLSHFVDRALVNAGMQDMYTLRWVSLHSHQSSLGNKISQYFSKRTLPLKDCLIDEKQRFYSQGIAHMLSKLLSHVRISCDTLNVE